MIPAIDVLDGRVVRLAQGRREAVTLEGGDPVALARRYERDGASRLHVVDLGRRVRRRSDARPAREPRRGDRAPAPGRRRLSDARGDRRRRRGGRRPSDGRDGRARAEVPRARPWVASATRSWSPIDVRDGLVAIERLDGDLADVRLRACDALRGRRGTAAARHEHASRRIARGPRPRPARRRRRRRAPGDRGRRHRLRRRSPGGTRPRLRGRDRRQRPARGPVHASASTSGPRRLTTRRSASPASARGARRRVEERVHTSTGRQPPRASSCARAGSRRKSPT